MNSHSPPAGRHWRAMSVADLPVIGALATRLHPSYPEDDAVFAERLRLYSEGCLVLAQGKNLAGYALSHPWRSLQPPALNSLLGELPAAPSTFYIHDLALAPEMRGTGAGSDIVALLADRARAAGLSTMSLIAVNGSAGFWQRQEFNTVAEPALASKLRSYGDAARFMVRNLK